MEIWIGGKPFGFRYRSGFGWAPGDDELRAELAGGDAQRGQDERVLGPGRRGEDVAIDAAHRAGRHHHRDRAAVELVVAADDDAVDIVDRDAGVGQCLLRGVVDHFLE